MYGSGSAMVLHSSRRQPGSRSRAWEGTVGRFRGRMRDLFGDRVEDKNTGIDRNLKVASQKMAMQRNGGEHV